ncbi:hypothetical protein [Streptomyces sp. NPDC002564]|uniref:NucA/NucB deoxyribonuclease domain-containing protein n=1 Tax=Streptomyces sp. NPDC002564 TaxID=3364649 RepID=UPI0036BD4239
MLISVALPASSQALDEPAPEMTVTTTVGPIGAPMPTLGDLKQHTTAPPATSEELTQPRAALETLGPAGRWAPKSKTPSSTAPPPKSSGLARQAAAAPYPDPPRTMSKEECLEGLRTHDAFYIKSRFAVCSGATLTSVWSINNRETGTSQVAFLAVGTIAKGSRTVNIRHHYRFEAVGTTGAPKMILTPKLTLPQTWPASARISQGGDLPTGKSWQTLAAQADPGFSHNLTGKSGTGSGRDDALFTIFQPDLKVKYPSGWDVKGATGAKPFFLAPRWDKASYLAGATADGGASFSYAVAMPFSTKVGAKERLAAQHIKDAYTTPKKTEPVNTKKDIPGLTASRPLTRLFHDKARRKANRDEAIKACKAKWGAGYAEGGKKECDEFPFSATYEGGAQALKKYDPQGKAPKKNFSARPIPKADNGAGGSIVSGFYSKNRIIDGSDDGFMIKVS